jgi:hypothetical protein
VQSRQKKKNPERKLKNKPTVPPQSLCDPSNAKNATVKDSNFGPHENFGLHFWKSLSSSTLSLRKIMGMNVLELLQICKVGSVHFL